MLEGKGSLCWADGDGFFEVSSVIDHVCVCVFGGGEGEW